MVGKSYGKTLMPGWAMGTLGYHTDDGKIYHSKNHDSFGYSDHDTKGLSLSVSPAILGIFALFL